jgi:hypothetical protein
MAHTYARRFMENEVARSDHMVEKDALFDLEHNAVKTKHTKIFAEPISLWLSRISFKD